MPLSEIKMKMSLDGSGVKKAINRMDANIKNFAGNAIRRFGAVAGAAGMGLMARKAIDLGSKISDLSEQLRINAVSLQTLQAVAVKAGVDQSTLERAIRNVSLRTQEAIDGNNTYGDSFRRLGIDLKTFTNLPTEQKLQVIADAYKRAGKSQEAFADVANVLGQRAGPKMLEILRRISDEGMSELEKAAQDAGMVMSNELIANLDESADQIGKFEVQTTVFAAKVLGVLMPAIQMLGNGFGFIGEILGVGIANMMAFFNLIGANLAAVVAPAVKSLGALGKAFQSTIAATKGDFKEAKKLATEAMDSQKEAFGELVDIPSKIAQNFKKMGSDVKSNFETMGQFLDERAVKFDKSWNTALENVGMKAKEAKGEVSQVAPDPNATIGGGTTGGGTTGGATDGTSKKMGLDIERGEFEGRSEFLLRREKARGANIELNEARRQVAAGGKTPDMAKIQELMSAAKGGKKDMAAEALKTAKESQELLKNINKGING